MQLRFDPGRPIYQQIIDEFKRAIARGELAPGDKIPSQRELATQARINPNTVQRAYREMEWLGLTETVRGQGTFVAQAPEALHSLRQDMAEQALERFIAEMGSLGFTGEDILRMTEQAVVRLADGVDGGGAKDGADSASSPAKDDTDRLSRSSGRS